MYWKPPCSYHIAKGFRIPVSPSYSPKMHLYGTVRVHMTCTPPYYVVAIFCRPYQPKKYLQLVLRSLRNNVHGTQKGFWKPVSPQNSFLMY